MKRIQKIFFIADERDKIMAIQNIELWGVRVTMPAVFEDEDQATAVLIEIAMRRPDLKGYRVIKAPAILTAALNQRAARRRR